MAQPLPSPRIEALQQAISAEISALSELLDILREEQRLLIAARPEGLEAVVAAKSLVLETVVARVTERARAMAAAGLPRNPDQAEVKLASHRTLSTMWRKLRRMARETAVVNSLNGGLATQKLQYVNARLDALRGAAGRIGTYEAHGRSVDASPMGRVIAAA